MFRQEDMVLQGKCKNIKVLVYKPAEVATLSIDYPPDKAGTRTAPRGSILLAWQGIHLMAQIQKNLPSEGLNNFCVLFPVQNCLPTTHKHLQVSTLSCVALGLHRGIHTQSPCQVQKRLPTITVSPMCAPASHTSEEESRSSSKPPKPVLGAPVCSHKPTLKLQAPKLRMLT